MESAEILRSAMLRARLTPKVAPKVVPIVEPEPIRQPIPVAAHPKIEIPISTGTKLKIILEEVAKETGLTVNDLQCESRNRPLIVARGLYCYRAITETLASYPMIGRTLGNRDHTTVIHAVRRHCRVNDLPLPRGLNLVPKRAYYGLRWTEEQVEEIGRLRLMGVQNADIAKAMNTTKRAVYSLITRRNLPRLPRGRKANVRVDQ
jgi:hypothetical protein